MSDPPPPKPFHIAIIGAGISGLSLSHALSLANISHTILEKHSSPVSDAGAVLFLWPHVARAFDQFGILEKFDAISTPLTAGYTRWAEDGSVFRENKIFKEITDRFNRPFITVDRQQVVDILYQNLPEPERLLTNKKVIDIRQDHDGVKVYLEDGSVQECDMVVGADGIHSAVRQHMWDLSSGEFASEKEQLVSEYVGMFGISTPQPSLGKAQTHLVYGHGYNFIIFTQPERVFWTVMIKDEKRPFQKRNYSDEAIAEAAGKLKDMHISELIKFEDLWNTRTRVGMVPLEEGVLDHWYSGRAVLIGDSVHKMTPDLGLGANFAIENAMMLANILHREVASQATQHPSMSAISAMLHEYQSASFEKAKMLVQISGQACRMNSQETAKEEHLIRHVMPTPAIDEMRYNRMTSIVNSAPKLDYVPTKLIDESARGWVPIVAQA